MVNKLCSLLRGVVRPIESVVRSGRVEGKHGEIVSDDGVELFLLPLRSCLRWPGAHPDPRLDGFIGNARGSLSLLTLLAWNGAEDCQRRRSPLHRLVMKCRPCRSSISTTHRSGSYLRWRAM